MPALSPADLINPSENPLLYPGRPVVADSLLAGGWVYRMVPGQGGPLGEYRVESDGGPLREARTVTLPEALSGLAAASINDRQPVLAVGSNAAAGQLAHKFGTEWLSTVIPMTATFVTGIGVGYSAHVSKAGYVPYAPLADGSNGRTFMVLWLDDSQLRRLNETEPNYQPSTLSGDVYRSVLTSGESLASIALYRGRWGVYRPSRDSASMEASTQEAIYDDLRRLGWFAALVPEIDGGAASAMAALAADVERREKVREMFAECGHRAEDGLIAS